MSEKRLAAVTGATGFIGSHLTKSLLAGGWSVRALVRNPAKARDLAGQGVELFPGDLENPESLEGFFQGADSAFHCGAAIHAAGRDAKSYARINAEGTARIARAAAGTGLRKFIALSSIAAIGIRPGGMIDENFPCQPAFEYGASKLQAEKELLSAHRESGLPVVILRPPTVYGAGERYNFLTLCRAIRNGPFLLIGDGANRIDFLAVSHLVEAMILAAEAGRPGEIYLVADARPRPFLDTVNVLSTLLKGKPYSGLRLPKSAALLAAAPLEIVARFTNAGMPLSFGRIRTMTSDFCYDLSKIRRELHYDPADDFRERMAETVSWYRSEGLI